MTERANFEKQRKLKANEMIFAEASSNQNRKFHFETPKKR